MTRSWNSRYVAYAYPTDPSVMLEADRKRYPGGLMTGYILWINDRWREFKRLRNLNGRSELEMASAAIQADFDEWLKKRAGVTEWPKWAPRDHSCAV